MSDAAEDEPGEVLAVHFGRSASCSSIGSFVDFLFVSTVVGTAVIGSVAALLREPDARREAGRAEPGAGGAPDRDDARDPDAGS